MTADFQKLGIIAGGGALPHVLIDACKQQKRPFHVLAIEGAADMQSLADVPSSPIQFGTMKKTVAILERESCDAVVMVGNVARPNFRSLKVDTLGARLLPQVIMAARSGDDALLRFLVKQFEKFGLSVIGADDVVGGLVIGRECLTLVQPSERQYKDIDKAFETALVVGKLDAGQGAVVCRGVILAIEAAEGTDAMLARCAELPENVRGSADDRDGVLVKAKKPNQERRTDLPVSGVETVVRAAKAGLAGIALEAEHALVLERSEVVEKANALGLFIVGIDIPKMKQN